MSQIVIRINGRDYPIVCDPGREERVRGIASYIDEKMREIVAQVGQAGDARLMLLAALNLGDELAGAYDELEELRAAPPRTIVDPALVKAAEEAKASRATAEALFAREREAAETARHETKAAEDSRARAEAATQSWIAKAEDMGKRLADYEAKLARGQTEAGAQAARLSALEAELADAQGRGDDADSRAIDAHARAGEVEGNLAALDRQHKELAAKLDAARAETAATAAKLAEARTRAEAAEAQIAEAQSRFEAAAAHAVEKERALAESTQTLVALKAANAEAEAELDHFVPLLDRIESLAAAAEKSAAA
ncbi:MAG: cell division protein ZapA [Proteobacteria bacterium]|nr:cell division protein ZapA [Pseudomonadota bacterium]